MGSLARLNWAGHSSALACFYNFSIPPKLFLPQNNQIARMYDDWIQTPPVPIQWLWVQERKMQFNQFSIKYETWSKQVGLSSNYSWGIRDIAKLSSSCSSSQIQLNWDSPIISLRPPTHPTHPGNVTSSSPRKLKFGKQANLTNIWWSKVFQTGKLSTSYH